MPDYVISARQSLGTVQLPGGSADSQLARAARDAAQAARDIVVPLAGTVSADAQAVEISRAQVSLNQGLVATDRATVLTKAGEVEAARIEVSLNQGLVADDRATVLTKAGEAEASRVAAGLSAGEAATSAANAQSALSLSGSYLTKALADAAIAGITEGHSVEVTNDPTTALNGTWAKRGGVLVQTSTYTVAALGARQAVTEANIRTASETNHPEIGWAARFANRIVGAWIEDDLRLSSYALRIVPGYAPYEFLGIWPIAVVQGQDGARSKAYAWLDQYGFDAAPSPLFPARMARAAPEPSGTYVQIPSRDDLLVQIGSQWLRCACRTDLVPANAAVSVEAEFVHGSTMVSQSNGVGGVSGVSDAVTIPDPVAPHHAFMPLSNLGGGPIHAALTAIDAASIIDWAPCREIGSESPVSAKLRWLYQRDVADGRAPYVYIGETHGYGGQLLTALSKGTAPYTNGLMLWDKAAKFAKGYRQKRVYYVKVDLRQGEAERSSVPPATWAGTFRTLRSDGEADIRAITGQPEPVWHGITQLCAPPGTNAGSTSAATWPSGIPDAHTALGQEEVVVNASGLSPRVTFNAPTYFLKGNYGLGGVHYKSLGDDLLGEYEAKADYIIREAILAATRAGADPWALTNRDVRTCLRIDVQNVTRVGAVCHLPLLLPAGCTGVEIDTTTLQAATHLGFYKESGTAGAITGAALSGSLGAGYEIQVTFASFNPGDVAVIRYAFEPDVAAGAELLEERSAAWGNVKATNSFGESIAVPGLALDDWLCVSQINLS